jgi:alanyl aminopeptidase
MVRFASIVVLLALLSGCEPASQQLSDDRLHDIGARYTAAWNSQDPARVAAFFAEGATLSVNGSLAVGRQAITDVAQSFMTAFPDMRLSMDRLDIRTERVIYHWTFVGTNTGPGGTGNAVRFSGYEEWTIGKGGLIANSDGHFDNDEYQYQLEHGVDSTPDGRLPDNVRPLAYRLDLLLDPRRDDFSGDVEIDIQLRIPTSRLWIHGQDLKVTAASARRDDGRKVAAEYEEKGGSGIALLRFAEELPSGVFTLRLEYSAAFNRNLAGLFKVEEQGEAYVLAKSESIQARRFLPGFDEPGLKARFDITLTVPSGYVAVSNGPETSREPVGDDMERITFAPTGPMSTYLLSLAVGPFDVVERGTIPANDVRSRPIPLRGIARKNRGSDMSYVLDITPRMLKIFEQELQQPYPFEKLDVVAAPQWPSGATELSAAITYREQAILLGDNPAPGARLRLLRVHAHELSHMWFGNLVTPPWWDDLWLKEGFTSWSEPVVLALFEPDGGHDIDGVVEAIGAMRQDSLASTRAIREPIASNRNIRNAYDSITYSKSVGVIHMVDQYFGAAEFRRALGRYIRTFANGVADSQAFYEVIGEETARPELTDTFQSFVEQQGVPQLTVKVQCGGKSSPVLSVIQARYQPLGSPIADTGQTWTIPVCVRSAAGSTQCAIVSERDATIALQESECPDWVLPNAGGSGYYRWNVSEPQWRALLQGFMKLEPSEALSMIDSAFAAFEAGLLPGSILLQVIDASSRSEVRQVIVAPLPFLAKYRRNYAGPRGEAPFIRFARRLYQPVIERTSGSANGDQQLLHSELLRFMAVAAKEPTARQQLLEKALAFTGFNRDRDPLALDSDLYVAALTVAVQDGDDGFPQHLLRVRDELDDPLFENASAVALGRITRPELIKMIHRLLSSDALGSREAFGLLSSALGEPALRDQHWQWLMDNFPILVEKIPGQWRRRLPRLGAAFCSADKREELLRLFDKYGNLAPGFERSLAQTDEQIQLCVALTARGRSLFDDLPR